MGEFGKYKFKNAEITNDLEELDKQTQKLVMQLKTMRDLEVFRDAGFNSFQEFCDAELKEFGGYARVCKLLGGEN